MIIQGPRESDGDAVAFVEGHPSPHVQRAALVGFIDPKKIRVGVLSPHVKWD